MKCAIGRVLEPEVTIIDGLTPCHREGRIACSQCGRLFCGEHSPQPCENCYRFFCSQCKFDHLNDNTAHMENASPN